MTPEKTGTAQSSELHHRAKERLKEKQRSQSSVEGAPGKAEDARALIQELQIHQIELEMKNEELRRVRGELEVSQERYFDLYDMAPVGYCTLNDQGLILETNLTAATLLGMARGALVKQPITRFILKADQDIYYNHCKQLFETGTPQVCELQMVKQDGTTFWAHLTARAAQDAEGSPVCRIVIIDITERRRTEEEQKVSKDFTEAVLDNLNDFLLVLDPVNYNILGANKTFINSCGLNEDTVIGKHCYELTHNRTTPCTPPDDICPLAETLKTRKLSTVEHIHYDSSGTKLHVEVSTIPIIGKDGEIHNVIHLSRNITERKQAEKTLQKTNMELLAIIDNLPFLAWLKDSEGRFLVVNEPFAHSCGLSSADDLVGKTDLDIWPQHLAEAYRADDYEVMRTRRKNAVEELISDQGVQKWFETYKAPLYDVDGNIIGTTGFSRDITERKQTEEAIRNAEARYRILFEQSPDGILLIDTKTGKTIEVNESAIKQLGYSREEFASLRISDYEAVEKPEETAIHKQTIIRDGSDDFETLQRTKSGEIRNVHVWVKTTELSGYNFFYTIFQDITESKRAEKQLQLTLDRLRKAVSATIQVMVSTVEARDPYTSGHQVRSADLARAIATEMDLPQEKIEGIRMAGSIHDIGKISIPAEILSKPTKLSDIEFSLIKEHANRGYEMLKDVESPWPLAEIVHQHHERMDGSGYPRNLKGEEICIEARILCVADVVEAMASHRPYRPGLGIDAALNEIEKNKGISYDNAVADACLRLFREKGFKLEGI
jgi:PAS domain S-box-containing protein